MLPFHFHDRYKNSSLDKTHSIKKSGLWFAQTAQLVDFCSVKTKNTREQLNKIIEFRQEIHQNCLTKYRDAQFDLMDSVLSNHRISSYAELTLSPRFKRQWQRVVWRKPSSARIASWPSLMELSQTCGGVQRVTLYQRGWNIDVKIESRRWSCR